MPEYLGSLVGFERLTIDWFFGDWFPGELVPAPQTKNSKMSFVNDPAWRRLLRSMPPGTKWSSGGSVGNALVAFAAVAKRSSVWAGVYDADHRSALAIRAMVELGIHNHGTCAPGCTTEVAIYSRQGEDPSLFIKVGNWPPEEQINLLPKDDCVLLVGLDSIVDSDAPLSRWLENGSASFAILVNHNVRRSANLKLLRRVLQDGRVCLLAGREEELAGLGARIGKNWEEWSAAWSCDTIATLGADGVVGYLSGSSVCSAVPAATFPEGTPVFPLGAGDALVGTYLAHRMNGRDFAVALEAGVQGAALVLREPAARRDPLVQVSELYGATVLSPIIELARNIRREIDWGSGVVAISGGQTGVDQIALSAATRNVIAAHAIVPQGLRTESGPLQPEDLARLGNPRVHILPEAGYQLRTWASAFIADATLLLFSEESSGVRETRFACEGLHRPLLELNLRELPDVHHAALWLQQRNIRVLNIAGHRGSLLTPEDESAIRVFLDALYPQWAQSFASNRAPSGLAEFLGGTSATRGEGEGMVKFAVPSSGEMKRQCTAKLGTLPMHEPQIYFGRVRDMGSWLKDELVDAAIGGLDDLVEGGATGDLILDFGTFRSSILLIGNGTTAGPFENVVSQFPKLARKLLARNRIAYKKLTPIWGGAETWLRLGAADACVDTWHTGATARSHGLSPIAHLGETSFCMLARNGLRQDQLKRILSQGRQDRRD